MARKGTLNYRDSEEEGNKDCGRNVQVLCFSVPKSGNRLKMQGETISCKVKKRKMFPDGVDSVKKIAGEVIDRGFVGSSSWVSNVKTNRTEDKYPKDLKDFGKGRLRFR